MRTYAINEVFAKDQDLSMMFSELMKVIISFQKKKKKICQWAHSKNSRRQFLFISLLNYEFALIRLIKNIKFFFRNLL